MKKFRVVLICVICLCVMLSLTACAKIKLATPIGVRINYDKLMLNWVSVNDAVAYEVSVDGEVVEEVRKTSWDMSFMAPGEYQIAVRAVGDGNVTKTSEWSQPVQFIRDAETGLEFKLYNNSSEYMVVGIGKSGANVVIPEYYRQKPVTRIYEAAFANHTRVKSVVVGSNVTVIDDKAFDNCSFMETITFLADEMQSIGANAFQRCWALKEITIPKGITTIGPYTFNYCKALEKVTFNDDLYVIDSYAFDGCSSLKEVVLPDSVVAIGEYAFNNCDELTSVTFGKNLLQLGQFSFAKCEKLATLDFGESKLQIVEQYAFTECSSLTEVALPSEVMVLGNAVFSFCTNLASVTIGDKVQHIGAYLLHETELLNKAEGLVYLGNWLVYNKDPLASSVEFKEGTVGVANQAFDSNSGLVVVIMPDTIKYVGAYAFVDCTSLMSVTLSNQLTEVPSHAFSGCINLISVVFGSEIESIGQYAFYNCSSLLNITLPNSVTKIGLYAFRHTKLWTDSTPGEFVYVGNWAVGFKPSMSPIMPETFKVGTVGIADYAFYEMEANYVTFPTTIQYLGDYSFFRVSMIYLKLSSSLKKVGDYAFFQCVDLMEVVIPEGVEEIGRSAFYQIQTTNIQLPQSVKTIGMYAFYRPAKLVTVNLGGVETIGRGAFYNAPYLSELVLPQSTKVVESYAFYGAAAMETLTLNEGLKEIGEYAFAKAAAVKSLKIPNSVTTIGRYAFRDAISCQSIVLGNALQAVGDGAFMNSGVTALTVVGNNVAFGKYVFRGCTDLQSVVITDSVKSFDMHAFYGSKKATFFIENNTDMTNWSARWNSSKCPVLSGVNLSADNSYVESFVKTNDTLVVDTGKVACAPVRDGFVFAGWSTTLGGAKEYTMDTLKTAPDGTTLYALWET